MSGIPSTFPVGSATNLGTWLILHAPEGLGTMLPPSEIPQAPSAATGVHLVWSDTPL